MGQSIDRAAQFRERLEAAVERVGRKHVYIGAEISEGSLSRIVNGRIENPGIWTVGAIASAAGVTVGELLGERGYSLTASDRAYLAEVARWIDAKIASETAPPPEREPREDRIGPRYASGPMVIDYFPEDAKALAELFRFRRPKRSDKDLTTAIAGNAAALNGATAEKADDDDSGRIQFRQIPDYYWERGARIVFKSRGDSLRDVGITESDLLFVAPSSEPHPTLPNVCIWKGKAVVKYVKKVRGQIRLRSKNPEVPVIVVGKGDEFRVLGYVVGRSGEPLHDYGEE